MARFVDQICSRRCQRRLTSVQLPQARWAPVLWFGGAVCSLSAGRFHQRVSNYRRGSHDSVSVPTPPQDSAVLSHGCCRPIGVPPSLELQNNVAKQGARPGSAPGRPVVVLCQPSENNNPHPGHPKKQVPIMWESSAPIYWCQPKLTADFFTSQLFHRCVKTHFTHHAYLAQRVSLYLSLLTEIPSAPILWGVCGFASAMHAWPPLWQLEQLGAVSRYKSHGSVYVCSTLLPRITEKWRDPEVMTSINKRYLQMSWKEPKTCVVN